jgi:hypothetical protein
VIDRFEETLRLFGNSLDLPLHIDKNGACAILVQGIVIQLQPNSTQEKLIVGCKIMEINPGRFRENVLKEALKANALADPRVGIFAYIGSINTLFLFQEYPFDLLVSGERIASLVSPFIKTCADWKQAVQNGQASPLMKR